MRSLSRALSTLVALAACGGEPPEPMHAQAPPMATTSTPAPVVTPAVIPPAPAPVVDERPVPPRARVDEKTILLESIQVYGDRVVFPDEAAPLADAVAAALAKPNYGGYKVVPPAELRRSWADARAGKLPDVAFVCEAAPTPFELSKALYPGASTARATVQCPIAKKKAPCVLEILVTAYSEPGDTEERERARLTMDLPRASKTRDWAAKILSGKLVAPKPAKSPDGMGMIGLLAGGLTPGVYVTVRDQVMEGPWIGSLTDKDLEPVRADLIACETSSTKRWRDFYGHRHLIEVAADGKVTRCESNLPERTPPPEFDCQCGALRKLSFGTAKAARRASFNLLTTTVGAPRTRKLLTMAFLTKARADDATAIAGSEPVSRPALEACLEALDSPLGEVAVPVRLVVGPDGKVKKHKAEWPTSIPKSAATCMDGALANGWFNCPIAGRATIDATLDLTVKRY